MGEPVGIPIQASSGIVAATDAVATLPARPNKTAYISGFEITAAGATAAALVGATVAGLKGGTLTYIYYAAAGATVGAAPLIVAFDPPLPASGVETPIVVTLPSLGAGNTAACVNARGYYLPAT